MTENPHQPHGAAQQQPATGAPGEPGQPGPGSRYGTAAYHPGGMGQEMPEPQGLRRLLTLTWASAAAYVASGLIGLVATQDEGLIRDTIESQGVPGMTGENLDQVVQITKMTGLATSLGMLVVALVLYVVVFLGLRKARNWARVLGTVLAALGVLSTVWSLTGIGITLAVAPTLGVLSLVVAVVYAAVNVWWLVTAYSKDVSAYLRARSGR